MPLDSDPPVSLTRAQIARLEAEARAVLAEVEPEHAAAERDISCGTPAGFVDMFPSAERVRVARKSDWRPRATRTPSGWTVAGGWLDEAVPELPKLPSRSKGAPRLFIRDGSPVMRLRGGKRASGTWRDRREVLRMWPMPIAPLKGFPDEAIGRGWCGGLAAATTWVCGSGTPAGWRAMQRAHDRVIAETDAAWAQERAEIVRAKGEG